MKLLLSCKYNMDTACVELRYSDGSTLALDCIEIENLYGNSPAYRTELDYLIYNDPGAVSGLRPAPQIYSVSLKTTVSPNR